jgi:hypothetical protein
MDNRYEEALEKAKELYFKGTNARNVLEEIFPQLREIEDEKIRKELTEFLKKSAGGHLDISTPYKTFSRWLAWIKKQGEQRPATFIPKFRKGNWIVHENIGVYKIIEICESWYEVVDGEDNDYSISFDNEYMCHFWNITKDAKSGDVLVTPNKNIFIFKNIKGTSIYDYCGLYFGKFNSVSGCVNGERSVELPNNYLPATKEQRDLLFQKMKEAGYEWNAEKKEPKKIKQNPAWSEEDEYMIQALNTYIDAATTLAGMNHISFQSKSVIVEEIKTWLKSIKHRNKKQWKPSEEQMKAFEFFIRSWGESGAVIAQDSTYNQMRSLYEDLKKI